MHVGQIDAIVLLIVDTGRRFVHDEFADIRLHGRDLADRSDGRVDEFKHDDQEEAEGADVLIERAKLEIR